MRDQILVMDRLLVDGYGHYFANIEYIRYAQRRSSIFKGFCFEIAFRGWAAQCHGRVQKSKPVTSDRGSRRRMGVRKIGYDATCARYVEI